MKNKIVRDVIDFVKGHQLLIDQVIRDDVSEANELKMEQMNLVVGILSKVRVLKDIFKTGPQLVSSCKAASLLLVHELCCTILSFEVYFGISRKCKLSLLSL